MEYLVLLFSFLLNLSNTENTPYDAVNWRNIHLDCPHPSCAVSVDLQTSPLLMKYQPNYNDMFTRRYIWMWNSSGDVEALLHFTELDGYVLRISTKCGYVTYSSPMPANGDRVLAIRATPQGIYVTFPGGRSWGYCVPIDVDKVGFDKLMKLDESSYSNGPEIVHSSAICDVRNAPRCNSTSYCSGYFDFCDTIEGCDQGGQGLPDMCKSCDSNTEGETVKCNSTRQCIAQSQRCDKVEDCEDGEDENNCTSYHNRTNNYLMRKRDEVAERGAAVGSLPVSGATVAMGSFYPAVSYLIFKMVEMFG